MTGPVIEVSRLRKSFGRVVAVDDVSFTARSGRVTGFIGPNGAGKTTTLRMLLGLTRPDQGEARFAGSAYRDLESPTRTVGAVLDIAAAHPAATARAHLRINAALGGHPATRVDELLGEVGLADAADRRVGGFSTGMRQRLSLATALLGDPQVLVLDEPSNGLDPAGMAWLRGFLGDFARTGRTVLLSSHVLSELQLILDDLVLIDRSRITWQGPMAGFTTEHGTLEHAFLARTTQGLPR